MPLATAMYSGNVFGFMKLEELIVGDDSQPVGMHSKLAGTHFTIRKIKFRRNFRSSKGPKSEINVEFRGISSGFPNQAVNFVTVGSRIIMNQLVAGSIR
jgi:hypothetical protein